MARKNKSRPPLIPAKFRDAAAEAHTSEEAGIRAFREQFVRDQRCGEAVIEFRHATNALWNSQPDEAQTLLPPVHKALLDACDALAEAGRLELWEVVDHERTYDGFRVRNHRSLSHLSYKWASELFGKARAGQLPVALLVETWETAVLRDAIRWLSVFIHGLSGEDAVLPQVQEQTSDTSPAPTDPRRHRESLIDNEYTVLRALRDKRPRLVLLADLAADTGIPRKACGKVVTSLIDRGLVERRSERTGATITPDGEALIASADAAR